MATNPLVPLGQLNRLLGSVSCVDNPQLNVTASYLGDDGISLTFEGEASDYYGVMVGAVPSPRPYQIATATIRLLKSQALSNVWETQRQGNVLIGDVTINTDTVTLDSYDLTNCTITGVNELNFAGKDPLYVVMIKGIYYINGGLFS